MSDGGIAREAAALLRAHIESFEQLEALVLLHGRPGDALTVQAIARELKLSEEAAEDALDHLRGAGIAVARAGTAPLAFELTGEQPLGAAAAALAQAYEADRSAVLRLLAANAIERVRLSAVRTFADAFVLGDKKPKGKG